MLSTPAFKKSQFTSDFVLLCHVTTRVPGDKHQDLLQQKGGGGFPYLAFLDSKGKVIGKPQGRSLEAFVAAGKTLPQPASSPILKAMRADLAEAREQAASKNYADAVTAYERVLAGKLDDPSKAEARDELAALESTAQGEVAAAEEKQEDDPLGAAESLRQLAATYRGLEAASSASTLASRIEASDAYRIADADHDLAMEIAHARLLLADGKVFRAHEVLTSGIEHHARHGAEGEILADAQETLASIEADPELMRAVAEGQAEKVIGSAIKTAKNYALNGRKDTAIKKLQKAIAQFPDTTWADEARKLIEEWGR